LVFENWRAGITSALFCGLIAEWHWGNGSRLQMCGKVTDGKVTDGKVTDGKVTDGKVTRAIRLK
jgi:hypothetical protein